MLSYGLWWDNVIIWSVVGLCYHMVCGGQIMLSYGLWSDNVIIWSVVV